MDNGYIVQKTHRSKILGPAAFHDKVVCKKNHHLNTTIFLLIFKCGTFILHIIV